SAGPRQRPASQSSFLKMQQRGIPTVDGIPKERSSVRSFMGTEIDSSTGFSIYLTFSLNSAAPDAFCTLVIWILKECSFPKRGLPVLKQRGCRPLNLIYGAIPNC